MIEAIDICAVLKENCAFESLAPEQMLPVCGRVLRTLQPRLREEADPDDVRLLRLAAALARFELFSLLLSESDRFSGYKAGDITIQKNLQAELRFEQQLRDEALAAAAPILRDGGFYAAAT